MQEVVVGMFKHIPVNPGHVSCTGCSFHEPTSDETCQHPFNLHGGGVIGCYDAKGIFKKVSIEQAVPARANDPATSKGKRKVNKYEQAVLNSLAGRTRGMTGKDIAYDTGHPLNCITPRFAPLRRKGLIKAATVPGWAAPLKRDKQIVWVLA